MKNDPMEKMVADTLADAEIAFVRDGEGETHGLDFYLPEHRVYIEVKQFHTDRIAAQTARVDDIIVLQGRVAVAMFCGLIDYQRKQRAKAGAVA